MFVMSQDEEGFVVPTNSIIKNNLKNWLSIYRSINDTVDIMDAKVVNFGIEFSVVTSQNFNSTDVMSSAVFELQDYYSDQLYIGEPIYISEIYRRLNRVNGVVDVNNVKVFIRSGGIYSPNFLDLDDIMSRDGTYYKTPKNVIFELKYPNLDIRGVIK